MPSTPKEVSTELASESIAEPTPERHVLSRSEIFSIKDLFIEWVDVPEWNGGVYVKGLTGTQRDHFERRMVEQKGKSRQLNVTNFRAKLIAATAVDSEDPKTAKLIFTDQDVEELAKKSARPLQRIYDASSRLSGFSAEEVDTLVDELGNDQSDGSGSA